MPPPPPPCLALQAENDEALLAEQPVVPFSGEEGMGRFLDLHEHYHTFINSKFGKQARGRRHSTGAETWCMQCTAQHSTADWGMSGTGNSMRAAHSQHHMAQVLGLLPPTPS